ncbi:MAG: hypothetical protein ABIN89_31465 [Chitinophagaceae bacterium]
MEKTEKLVIMNKVVRELDDLVNSETSLLKKLGQLEADNINLGDKVLEAELSGIYEHVDNALSETSSLHSTYTGIREQFIKDNNLEEVVANANITAS